MEDKIVTLEAYYDPMLAEITLARLQANGISCFLADTNILDANPFYNQAVGGIKLKVFEHDVERCRAILAEDADLELTDEEVAEHDVTCPHCHSGNVRYGTSTKTPGNWFSGILSFLAVGFPFAAANKAWHCFNCGEDFE